MTDKPVLTFEGWGVMPEHTPGPWEAVHEVHPGGWQYEIHRKGDGDCIAVLEFCDSDRAVHGNALILGAALDMLAALKKAAVRMEAADIDKGAAYLAVLDAIAKAEGECS